MAAINRHGHPAGHPRRRPRFRPRLPPRLLHDEALSSGRLRFRPRFPLGSFHPGHPPDKTRYVLHPSFRLGKAPRSGNRHFHQQKQPETFQMRHRVTLLSMPNVGVCEPLHSNHFRNPRDRIDPSFFLVGAIRIYCTLYNFYSKHISNFNINENNKRQERCLLFLHPRLLLGEAVSINRLIDSVVQKKLTFKFFITLLTLLVRVDGPRKGGRNIFRLLHPLVRHEC
jgi:hypothetical protein